MTKYSIFVLCLLVGKLAGAIKYTRDIDDNGYRAPPPAILTHKQAVNSDGVFNYVFAADNGLKQGESISPDGTRTGAYQYIDPSGKTISVKYMAGKDGFRIIEGDHIPLQPQPVKPIPEYQPPEYREKLEAASGNQKYKTSNKHYKNNHNENYQAEEPRYKQEQQQYQQEQPRYQQEQSRYQQEQPRYQQEQPRYQQNKDQQYNGPKNLFRPAQNNGRQQSQPGRSMLYDVEQRHDVNYRKYLDNGQAADGQSDGSQGEKPYRFDGGYNFEING